jgi:hypothetical protein
VRIKADAGEREFGHVGAPDQHSAGLAQAGHDRRVGTRGWTIAKHGGAGARHLAGNVEQVLCRDWQSGERRKHIAGPAQPVLRVGGEPRTLGIDLQEGARALARRIGDRRQGPLDQIATGGSPGREIGGECQNGRTFDHVQLLVVAERCRGIAFAATGKPDVD